MTITELKFDVAMTQNMKASFEFNGTHCNCINNAAPWAKEITGKPHLSDSQDSWNQMCVTDKGILARFAYSSQYEGICNL